MSTFFNITTSCEMKQKETQRNATAKPYLYVNSTSTVQV